MKLCNVAAAVAIMATTATSANAAITVYTDRAAFQAALTGGFSTETFNGVVGEPNFRTTPLSVGSLTLQGSGAGQSDRNYIDQPPVQFTEFDIDGTAVVNAFIASNSSVQLSFSNAVLAFGADFAGLQSVTGDTQSTILVGNVPFTPAATGGSVVRFIGFISDTAFSTVGFTRTGSFADGFAMDNVIFSPVAAIPEPQTWLLTLMGLASIGWAARRLRTQAASD